MSAHLRFVGVRKAFATQQVLRGVDLRIERGSVHFVLGPSGAGKSVLAKHVVGLLRPDAGSIFLGDEDITHAHGAALRHVRARCQLVLQSPTLFDQFTVAQNVALPLRDVHGKPPQDAEARARDALQRVGAAQWAGQMPYALSIGIHKRIAVARALVMQPEIILYDEPTTGLDPESARATDALIADTARTQGVTSVVVSHDLMSVRRIADTVSFLDAGVVLCTQAREAFFESVNPVVQAFTHPPNLCFDQA